jgi:hypothetical protein
MKDASDPHAALDESFWEKPWSRAKVGIRAPVVSWSDFWKEGQVLTFKDTKDSDNQVNEYRLEMMRKILDGIFAKETVKQWDVKPENFGAVKDAWANNNEAYGAPKAENRGKFASHVIIDIANSTIPDLNYPYSRIVELREKFGMKVVNKI